MRIKLLGSTQILRGHVESLARGIQVPNAQPDAAALAKVNPIFTWVRLAQRVPVRIHLDSYAEDVPLVAGMTATVQIASKAKQPPTRSESKYGWVKARPAGVDAR